MLFDKIKIIIGYQNAVYAKKASNQKSNFIVQYYLLIFLGLNCIITNFNTLRKNEKLMTLTKEAKRLIVRKYND